MASRKLRTRPKGEFSGGMHSLNRRKVKFSCDTRGDQISLSALPRRPHVTLCPVNIVLSGILDIKSSPSVTYIRARYGVVCHTSDNGTNLFCILKRIALTLAAHHRLTGCKCDENIKIGQNKLDRITLS